MSDSRTLLFSFPFSCSDFFVKIIQVASLEKETPRLLVFRFLMHWRRQWQPTPVFLPGESQGRGSLAGCRLWGHTESDTTEATWQQQQQQQQQVSDTCFILVEHAKSLQSCLTLCNCMDHSTPGSSAHGILQARILEGVAMPSSRGSS